MFTEREQKLIRLAMDAAAHPGERDNCATMLIQSLLKRGISSDQLIKLSGPTTYEAPKYKQNGASKCRHCGGPDWGNYVFDFGKHKGKTLRVVPLDYLQWCLRELPQSKPHIVDAIKRYINHTPNP